MLDVGKIKFHTKSTYPIDMVIDSKYALVYDVTANEILFEKNADQSCFPASTTKLLTAAVALQNAPSDMVYTIGDELDLVSAGSSLAMLEKGNELDNEMMIDALMLPSGNDAAYGTAANIGKILLDNPEAEATEAVKAFVDEMNQTATYIGCENTNFTAPDGFHDPNHSTTLYDMLRISLYAGKFPMIETSVAKPYTRTTILSGEVFDWSNSNQLIQEYSDTYYYYANGMKTGMTDEAGYCVVASAERYSRQVICLVFGGTAADRRWNDTVALLDAAFVEIKKGLD